MARYVAVRKSFGFRGVFWAPGEEITLREGEVPPAHFVRIDGPQDVEMQKNAPAQEAPAEMPPEKRKAGKAKRTDQ